MKRGDGNRFTPSGIDCYFVTVMTDNRFKQQTSGQSRSFRRENDFIVHAQTIRSCPPPLLLPFAFSSLSPVLTTISLKK